MEQPGEQFKKPVAQPKLYLRVSGCLVVLVLLSIACLYAARRHAVSSDYATSKLVAGQSNFTALIADTPYKQEKGLGQRASLPANQVMIFWYDQNGSQCFWMKDMQFPIDMVWADGLHKVAAVESDVKPDTYPKTYCHDGQYVLEFNAGTAQRLGLKPGFQLTF